MIDIDIARRLRDAGLDWTPADGDLFVIDNEQLREEPFMLSTMVIETGRGRAGEAVFRFNGTTEWALDSVEQHEAVWIPREDQLRAALGEAFGALRREDDGGFVVELRDAARSRATEEAEAAAEAGDAASVGEAPVREVPAPEAEDALAGALLIHLTR